MSLFSKPGWLLLIPLAASLTACLAEPTPFASPPVKSPIPTVFSFAGTQASTDTPVLKDSATLRIHRVIPLGDDFSFTL